MPFQCPDCTTSGSLRITARLELPSDSRSDEIALQIVECTRCGFAGLAVYEESRRGALDEELVDHTGHHVSTATVKALRQAIRACPSPTNPHCACPTHKQYGRRDAGGRWDGLAGLDVKGVFRMGR